MTRIVNVRFRDAGKTYRFSCDGVNLSIGDAVMVETTLGTDLAHVCEEPYDTDTEDKDTTPILHKATEAEIERLDGEIERVSALLATEEVASDYERLIELTNELEQLNSEQEKQYEIWEELSD